MRRLPDLPFGNAGAEVVTDSRAAAEALAAACPAKCSMDADKSVPFATKSAARRIGDLGVIASAVSSARIEVEEARGWHLIIPFFGFATMQADRASMTFEGGRRGMLMPNIRRFTDSTSLIVAANLDIEKLRATAGVMLGVDPAQTLIEDRPHTIDMRRQREMFPAFQHLCALVEVTSGNPEYARTLGIEDAFYRWTVHALALLPQDAGSVPGEVNDDHRLDVICDLVRTAHERPITLTEMERLSGLSARALQYAFKTRFGCSPMEWQRRERLQLARSRLISPAPGETITAIAHAMGFSSSAAFATQYRHHYGETPSQTRRFAT
jgi:AraC-like DNA-binding protein